MDLGLAAAAPGSRSGDVSGQNEAIARESGSDSLVVPRDVREGPPVRAAVDEVVAQCGHVDVLVTSAGNFIVRPIVAIPFLAPTRTASSRHRLRSPG